MMKPKKAKLPAPEQDTYTYTRTICCCIKMHPKLEKLKKTIDD